VRHCGGVGHVVARCRSGLVTARGGLTRVINHRLGQGDAAVGGRVGWSPSSVGLHAGERGWVPARWAGLGKGVGVSPGGASGASVPHAGSGGRVGQDPGPGVGMSRVDPGLKS